MSIDRNLVDAAASTAFEYERVYHGCSQCTLKALQEHLGLGDDLTYKSASALAGGVARTGETCGAVLGAVMAIGLAFGRDKLEVSTESPSYTKAQDCAGRFVQSFIEETGSMRCKDIQESIFGRSFDMTTLEGREQFLAAGGHEKCPQVPEKAARLAAEIILEERQ
jgi:C_GCAxxG_C_C family probable redox protein